MLRDLKSFLAELKELRNQIKTLTTKTVSKTALRAMAEELGEKWFSDFESQVKIQSSISPDKIVSCSDNFKHLIIISAPSNLQSSYLETLSILINLLQNDLIPNIRQHSGKSSISIILISLINELQNDIEGQYFQEASECAQYGLKRATVILGLCSAIDRVQRKIEQIGFAQFNLTSQTMANQTTGRFKNFNKAQNVNSLSELRVVFDNDILWIIEGMGLIDSNQHTRLRGCFDMRCQCAHPGEAPITEPNLLSFFSDLKEIIFKNRKFNIDAGN